MKNFASIRVPSVSLPGEEIQGQTIYRGVNVFTAQVSERLRTRLSGVGVTCSPVFRSHKPDGSGFHASSTADRVLLTVSLEREVFPKVEVAIWAQPRAGFWRRLLGAEAVRGRSWGWFEPLFRAALESEFSGGDLRWMTEDEYVQSDP